MVWRRSAASSGAPDAAHAGFHEAVFLLADRLFGLGARRVGGSATTSTGVQIPPGRLGFTFGGVRQHMIVKGHNRVAAWFSLLDHEWPARRQAILAWLREDNFVQGQQRQPLQR